MFLIYILIALLLVLIAIDLVQGFRLKVTARLGPSNREVKVTVLYPLFEVIMDFKNGLPDTEVYILGIKLFSILKKKQRISMSKLIRSIHVSNIELFASYGISDPFALGISYGVLNFLVPFFHIKKAEFIPDFISMNNYFLLEALANIKVGHTIIDYFKK